MEKPPLLLVEDEPLIQEALTSELRDAGFDVVAVADGSLAMAELNADANRFKAVITDIRLPGGPDGWDLGHLARERVSDMPIIYITGDSTHEWSSKGVPDSIVIAKPFAAAQLITMVSKLIVNAETHRALRPHPPNAGA